MTLKVGDRVRYRAGLRDDWEGKEGTISHYAPNGTATVEFDDGDRGFITFIQSLELIMPINTSKPLGIDRYPDTVTFVGKLANGDIFVTASECSFEWAQFRKDGSFKASSDGSGKSLRLINIPERTSGFYPLDPNGYPTNCRGLISLDFAKSEYPTAKHFIEIVYVDKVPTEVHLHVRPS